MSSLDKLASILPKENAGASSSNRFEYQINWGLHRLLQLEDANEDYVMILDYHDDIVVCNSDSSEDYIDFYQIKTKTNSNWGIRNLCDNKENKKENGEEDQNLNETKEENNSEQTEISQNNIVSKISIVAKLLKHSEYFEDTRKLYFVTNAHISFIGNKKACQFSELSENNKTTIKEKIKQQIGDIEDEKFDKLIFVQNEMSETMYKNTMFGELMNFLKNKLEVANDTDVIYENLTSWLRRQTNFENIVNNKQDLLRYKAITHKEFRDYILRMREIKDFKEIVQKIQMNLRDDMTDESRNELTFQIKSKIKRELSKIKCDILNYDNDELYRLMNKIKITLKDGVNENDLDLWVFIKRIYNTVMSEYNNYMNYEEYYIKSLILYLYEKD